MTSSRILGVEIGQDSQQTILYKIKKNILGSNGFYHIVSLNPEILYLGTKDAKFKEVVASAQMRINDGTGIVLAARLLGLPVGARMTGVDLAGRLLEMAGEMRLRVLLIGGKGNLAKTIADCYQARFPEAKFAGTEGIENIQNPLPAEEEAIFSIVGAMRPHLIIAAFGSPWQELWIWRHRDRWGPAVAMGAGGSFDFIGGRISRAPLWLRKLGMEWLWRLAVEPWRWRRQLRLVAFLGLVLQQKRQTALTGKSG